MWGIYWLGFFAIVAAGIFWDSGMFFIAVFYLVASVFVAPVLDALNDGWEGGQRIKTGTDITYDYNDGGGGPDG